MDFEILKKRNLEDPQHAKMRTGLAAGTMHDELDRIKFIRWLHSFYTGPKTELNRPKGYRFPRAKGRAI